MAANEGSETRQFKLLPFHSRVTFSFLEWKAYLGIYVSTVPLGAEALAQNTALLVETVAQKNARIARYSAANSAIIMAISQSAMNCDEARPICVAFQMSAESGSSFALLNLLEVRYTQKKDQRLHKLVLELN